MIKMSENVFVICLVLIFVSVVLLGCQTVKTAEYEFSTVNIFSVPNITGENVSLNNIALGASINDVVTVFGKPDNKKEYILEGETNIEYGQNINLSDNGLIFHFDNGTLTRMTIKQQYTEHYNTATQLNFTKREAYEWLGIPDNQTTILTYRVFTYEKKGIDLFLKGKNVNRVSFFVSRKD